MSDIIQDAKTLLDGATPGPWVISGEFDPEYPELQGAPQLENGLLEVPIISHNIYGDFFPEDGDLIAKSWTNAKALAEETWEYAVQVKIGAKWLFLGRGTGGHNFARNAFWFVKKEKAQDYMVIGKDMSAPARLVRRRVSPPEVINE